MAGAVAVAALCAADVVVAPWTAPARAATTDDFDRFRLQWLATMVRHYDPADAVLVKYAQDTAAVASEFWRGATPLNTSDARTYLWQDLHDPTVSRQSALMTSTTVRLRQLALGLKTPGSSLASDPQLKSDLLSAIDWFLANSYHTVNRAGNLVGLADRHPKALNDFCVLMYDELSTEQIDTAMAAIRYYEPDPAITGGSTSTGANRNWACAVTMLRGALSRDQATIHSARLKLETIFPSATSGDGMYPDGGFVQHVYYAYTAGYGVSLLQVLSYMMVSAVGTPWAFSTGQTAEVFDWTQNNFAPWIYGGGFVDMLHGRGISRFYETDRRIGRLALGTELKRTIPSTQVMANLANLGALMMATTHRLHALSESTTADELVTVTSDLRGAANALKDAEATWKHVTTLQPQGRAFGVASFELFDTLRKVLAAPTVPEKRTDVGLDVEDSRRTLDRGVQDLAQFLGHSHDITRTCLNSGLLFAPARGRDNTADHLRARTRGEYLPLVAARAHALMEPVERAASLVAHMPCTGSGPTPNPLVRALW